MRSQPSYSSVLHANGLTRSGTVQLFAYCPCPSAKRLNASTCRRCALLMLLCATMPMIFFSSPLNVKISSDTSTRHHRRGAIAVAASADVITGITSKSAMSFHCASTDRAGAIRRFHDLKATVPFLGHPAAPVDDAFRHQPPAIPKSPVHRHRIARVKGLNDHKQHERPRLLTPRRAAAT